MQFTVIPKDMLIKAVFNSYDLLKVKICLKLAVIQFIIVFFKVESILLNYLILYKIIICTFLFLSLFVMDFTYVQCMHTFMNFACSEVHVHVHELPHV